jgi:patatin-like phospholipase/acyl hydrolase
MAFQILSLSGGGFLCLYNAAVLAELEESSGRRLTDCFNLLAGTSIGGIVAFKLSMNESLFTAIPPSRGQSADSTLNNAKGDNGRTTDFRLNATRRCGAFPG